MSTELPSEADLTLGIRTESFSVLSVIYDRRTQMQRDCGPEVSTSPLRCPARSSRSYEASVSRNDPHQALRRGAGRLLTVVRSLISISRGNRTAQAWSRGR